MVEEECRERNGEHDRDEEQEEDVKSGNFALGTRCPEHNEVLREDRAGGKGDGIIQEVDRGAMHVAYFI